MKLKFYKEGESNFVKIVTKEGEELEFDYIKMIEQIYKDKGMEEAEIDDQYSEEETDSIKKLIMEISTNIKPLFDDDSDIDDLL